MNARWMELGVVAIATVVAALWTGDATVAAMPAVVYAIFARADGCRSRSAA